MNAKGKKELMILSICIIGLILSIIYVNRPKNTAEKIKAPLPHEVFSEVREGVLLPRDRAESMPVEIFTPAKIKEITYTGGQNRDPLDNTIVLEKEELKVEKKKEIVFPKEKFLVSAVIWDVKKPQAIINNKIIKIGEMLEGAMVVGIDKKGVHVNLEGKEVLLPIK